MMQAGATINGDYRYALWRRWDDDGPTVAWIMLNPSTADASEDDPTIRRCIGFSKAWGFGALIVVNQFALRATDPRELLSHPDPRGQANETIVRDAVSDSIMTVAAWGTFKVPGHQLLDLGDLDLRCLGTTKDGSPKHPLYLAASTSLEDYR